MALDHQEPQTVFEFMFNYIQFDRRTTSGLAEQVTAGDKNGQTESHCSE